MRERWSEARDQFNGKTQYNNSLVVSKLAAKQDSLTSGILQLVKMKKSKEQKKSVVVRFKLTKNATEWQMTLRDKGLPALITNSKENAELILSQF